MRNKDKKRESGKRLPFGAGLAILLALLAGMFLYATLTGTANLSAGAVVRLIAAKLPKIGRLIDISDISNVHQTILYKVRLPRIVLAGLVGMGLSLTGAAFQGLFRNPLADPHILGVSSGAALGATISVLVGANAWYFGLSMTGLFALAGGLATVFLVYMLAGTGGGRGLRTVQILLTGTAMNALLSSLISLLMTRNSEQLEKIYMWTLGSFSAASWEKVRFLGIFVLVCATVLFLFAKELDLLASGEDTAQTLGVSLRGMRVGIIVTGTLLVAVCVSVSGVISFVGLIVPHCTRLIFGPGHRRLLPYAMLSGALFMIFCDMLARTVASPTEIPVGVVTSILGAPYFIFLLWKEKRN